MSPLCPVSRAEIRHCVVSRRPVEEAEASQGSAKAWAQKTALFISTEGSGAEIKIPEETRVLGFIFFRMTENTAGPVCECGGGGRCPGMLKCVSILRGWRPCPGYQLIGRLCLLHPNSTLLPHSDSVRVPDTLDNLIPKGKKITVPSTGRPSRGILSPACSGVR